MDDVKTPNELGREALSQWQEAIRHNVYTSNPDFIHTIQYHCKDHFNQINAELTTFGQRITTELEPLVAANHESLPKIEAYDSIGNRIDKIIHHPAYLAAGDIIYGSKLMARIATKGGLLEGLSLFFISSHAGEAGHNCPIACSAGILRVLRNSPDVPHKDLFIEKLCAPSYHMNVTGAQFLTELQGGSDVGLNAVHAKKETNNLWRVYGEKWFCSNAGAELIFITARYDQAIPGTKGLGLFLIPKEWNNGKNNYILHRLKDKIGTRTMATGEIDFNGAFAYPIAPLEEGINLVMDNVLHISRLFNAFCVLGMARRAYAIAHAYAQYRVAFEQPILHYPLVKETLAKIKSENTAMIAGIYETVRLQDQLDKEKSVADESKLLLRLLVNVQKYLTAIYSVEHVHQTLGILAGNGTIETFSPIPRLFRDSIVCENWEGTHNVLRAQVLRDMHKYNIDQLFFSYMRAELQKIPAAKATVILNSLQLLEQDVVAFKKLDKTLQSLQIRMIIDRMAILFCALRLLFEALDQEKATGSASKMDCFQYFCELHINKDITYNEHYVQLISRIVNT